MSNLFHRNLFGSSLIPLNRSLTRSSQWHMNWNFFLLAESADGMFCYTYDMRISPYAYLVYNDWSTNLLIILTVSLSLFNKSLVNSGLSFFRNSSTHLFSWWSLPYFFGLVLYPFADGFLICERRASPYEWPLRILSDQSVFCLISFHSFATGRPGQC